MQKRVCALCLQAVEQVGPYVQHLTLKRKSKIPDEPGFHLAAKKSSTTATATNLKQGQVNQWAPRTAAHLMQDLTKATALHNPAQ